MPAALGPPPTPSVVCLAVGDLAPPTPREPKSPSANFSSAIGRIAEYLLNRSSNIDFPLSPSFCEISPSRHQCALYVHHSANGVFKFHSSMQFCVISLSRSIGRFSTFESDKASSVELYFRQFSCQYNVKIIIYNCKAFKRLTTY